nr:MAG: nucleocapsid [Tibet bird virus 2]
MATSRAAPEPPSGPYSNTLMPSGIDPTSWCMDMCLTAEFKDLAIDVSKLEYQGFDPIRIYKLLAERAAVRKLTAKEHSNNIKSLAVLGTMRGSNIDRIRKSSLDEAVEWLEQMMSIYNIVPGTPKTNKDITIMRIAAISANMMVKGIAKGTWIIPTTIDAGDIAEGFPKCMCISNFGAMIPTRGSGVSDPDLLLIKQAFAFHQYTFDRVINSKKPKAQSNRLRILNFINIQAANKLFSNEHRIDILTESGILVCEHNVPTVSAAVRPALMEAQRKWDSIIWPAGDTEAQ